MLNWSTRRAHILLAGVTLIAAAARFYRITTLPPGLHFDEAFENIQALSILSGHGYPVFFEGNYGVEPTLIYLIALFYRVFGVSALAGRLIAATVGTLSVPALYLLMRTVFLQGTAAPQGDTDAGAGRSAESRAALVGLLSASSLALLFWHVHFSRLGIEPILVPLNATLMLYFLWQGLETGRVLPFILAGALVGFGPYTYPAGRLLPVLAAGVVVHRLLTRRQPPASSKPAPGWRECGRGLALAVFAAAVVFAPLGRFFAEHPHLLTQRMSQVSVVTPAREAEGQLETIAANLESVVYMYTVRGDSDIRNNVPNRPVLDLGWSALFLVGVAVCLVRCRQTSYALPLWWLVVMTIPTVLSEYPPHFRRALGASPAVAVLVAVGAATLLEWLAESKRSRITDGRGRTQMGTRLVAAAMIAIVWLYGAGAALHAYFVVWAQMPALYYAFDVGLQTIGEYVRELPPEEMAYLSPVRQDHQTIIFTVGQEFRPVTFDGRRCLVLPPPERAATYIHLMAEDRGLPGALRVYLPDLRKVRHLDDYAGEIYAGIYEVPAGSCQVLEPGVWLQARLGDSIELLGADVPASAYRPGEALTVTVYWRALDAVDRDYTVSVQLHGPFNPATDGPLWAQEDAQPGEGTYPTSRWTRGETIIESYSPVVPATAPPGVYSLQASMYWLATLERLPVTLASSGGQSGVDTVELGKVEIVEGSATLNLR